ncbi:MAG: hypothetical protein ABIJ59_06780 [Pseudomonadota bacterium]
MSLLKGGVYYKLNTNKGNFYKDLSDECESLLNSIKRRKREKFNCEKDTDKKLIPQQLLQVLWNRGFLPGKEIPKEGMRLKPFLDLLSHGDYMDQRHRYKGIWLRDKIYDEEFPSQKREPAIFVGINNKNLLPVSYLRTIPGTIYR